MSLLLAIALPLSLAGSAAAVPGPPIAAAHVHETLNYGVRRSDPYAWLRNKADPEVRRYLQAENAYADTVLAAKQPLRDALYSEMVARMPAEERSPPYREGHYEYQWRTAAGQQYRTRSRTPRQSRAQGGLAELVLDENAMAAGQPYFALEDQQVSPDGKQLAYLTDNTGFRQYVLQVRDIATGAPIGTARKGVTSLAWSADSKVLYYVTEDDVTKRPSRLYARGSGAVDEQLVYQESDAAFRLHLHKGRQGRHIFLTSGSATSSEVRYLSARDNQWQLLRARTAGVRYDAEARDGLFYLRINDQGPGFRVITGKGDGVSPWRELVAHREGVQIEKVELFRDFMVLHERTGGLMQLAVTNLRSGGRHNILFSDALYELRASENRDWNSGRFRYAYQSPTTPRSIIEHDMKTQRDRVLEQGMLPVGLRRDAFITERRYANADDGTLVPISLIYRKDVPLDGSAPLHLSAYGAYGSSARLDFSTARLSLLERGVIVAIAHVRGGGELGQKWHDGGRLANKGNTFSDFIRCAETLVAMNYTSSARMVAHGRSAGGLLIGAVVNMRPDLFKAVIAEVPFVDVLNTMLDPSLPLVVGEYDEWGNPSTPEGFETIRAYSPYDNLKPQRYPAMLVKAGFNDSQVMYWEPAKYVARMRTVKQGDSPLLLVTNMEAGHGGASGRFSNLHELALDYAFILDQMGKSR